MLVNVVVPRPWWNNLIYDLESDFLPEKGTRILIPLGKSDSVGFISDFQVLNEKKDFEIRNVKKILESKNTLQDLWDLALWTGKTYLCGTGLALKMIFPTNFLKGEPLPEISNLKNASENAEFKERNFFCPLDSERHDFLINELSKNQKILLLFALKDNAKNFYSKLPDNLKNEALLWQPSESKKHWDNWLKIYKGNFRIIIGSQSAVFAPFKPEKIIVEDEANPAYTFFKFPQASARTLAGKRASFLKSEFVTCGRMPSIKTFLRSNPKEKNYYINKKFFVTADSDYSFKESEKGIKGEIPLTYSLIERTQKTLSENKIALWILDRLGEAGEIFCVHCGESLKCKVCGGILRTNGNLLKCVNCGKIENMPSECEACHHSETFFSGKRPGLDTLKNIAEKYFDNVILFNNKKLNLKKNSLILGTNSVLNLCDNENIGLIAWLDLDNELRKPFYDSRFNVFRLLWDSYWRNRNLNDERILLIQTRSKGILFANSILKGWESFLNSELNLRKDLFLPPYNLMLEINAHEQKNKIINEFQESGFFVMDSGDTDSFSVNTKSLEKIRNILEKYFSLSELKKIKHTPEIKIFAE